MTTKDTSIDAPLFPADYGNHAVYGFVLASAIALVFQYFDWPIVQAWSWAYYLTLTTAITKKVFDAIEGLETIRICNLKVLATVSVPTAIVELIRYHLI